jgi:predicted nucleic acid-binding protein
MIALDSSAIIDVFKNVPEILALLKSLEEDLCSTITNYQEIAFGLDVENIKHAVEEKFYDNFFEGIFLFDLDKKACKHGSRVYWELVKNGKMIEDSDCVIAGILLSNGINKIITRNAKHFENIKGLKVISY